MRKSNLITAFDEYIVEQNHKKELIELAEYFRWYFATVPKDEHEHDRIFHSLARYIVDACELLRNSNDQKVRQFRQVYLQTNEIRNIPELTVSSAMTHYKAEMIQQIEDLFEGIITSPSILINIKDYLLAADYVLQQQQNHLNMPTTFLISTAAFVAALKRYDTNYHWITKGDPELVSFFYWYFQNKQDLTITIPVDIAIAMECLRTDDDKVVNRFRQAYLKARDIPEMPKLTSASFASTTRALDVIQIANLIDYIITGNSIIEAMIQGYFFAEDHVIDQCMQKFVRQVYRQGLFDLINQSSKRGMSAQFEKTELRTYIIAGRILFTFASRKSQKLLEETISFVTSDDDLFGIRFGVQSIATTFEYALKMIAAITKNWPVDTTEQSVVFHDSDDITLI